MVWPKFWRWMVVVLYLALVQGGAPAWAGAPTLLPGSVQIIASQTFAQGERQAGAQAADEGQGRASYRKDELEVLAEYGLLDGVTILFSPRLTVQSVSRFTAYDPGHDVTLAALGRRIDAGASGRLGVRARLLAGQHDLVSVEVSGRGGILAGDVASPVMRRAAELEARLLWQRQFQLLGKPWFVDVQAGYRHYFEAAGRREPGLSDGVAVVDATLGVHLTPRIMLLLQNFSLFPVGGHGGGAGSAGPYASGSSHKAQASVAWRLSQAWTVQAGVMGTWAGSSPWRERGIVIGVWRRFGG